MILREHPGCLLSEDLGAAVGVQRVVVAIDEVLGSRLAVVRDIVRSDLQAIGRDELLFSVNVIPVDASLCDVVEI